MSVETMLAGMLRSMEEQLYDEPVTRAMLSDVAQRLTFATDQLDALIRDGHQALRCEQAVRLARVRCAVASDGLSWLQVHANTKESVLFDQLHVVFQEVRGTLALLEAATTV